MESEQQAGLGCDRSTTSARFEVRLKHTSLGSSSRVLSKWIAKVRRISEELEKLLKRATIPSVVPDSFPD